MEQYIHLLIARPDDFTPDRASLAAFGRSLLQHCVVPAADRIAVSAPTGKSRSLTNPLTGQEVILPSYAHQSLTELDQFVAATEGLANYCLHLEGIGRPALPPIPIDFADPYSIAVRCHVTAVPHSTSSPYDDEISQQLIQYDRPCPDPVDCGYFTDPTTNETVEVVDAGRARFWIEFELGKWLFPSVKRNNLSILNSEIVALADRQFGITFAQGCHYF